MSLELSANDIMEDILQEFECPICLNVMVPPIHTCVAGHSLCSDCDEKLLICPICRGEKIGTRNHVLENIFKQLIVPCQNASKGCTAEVQGERLDEHLKFCQYTITICPLRAIQNCRWKGQRKDSIDHCFRYHSNNVHDNKIMHLKKLEQGGTYHIIIRAHGELFKCVADFITIPNVMIWHVICLDPQTNADKYYFEVVFRDVDDDVLAFGRSRCQAIDCAVLQENGLQVKLEDNVKNVCGDQGSYYTISIFKFKEGQDLNTLASTPVNTDDLNILNCFFTIPKPSRYLDLHEPGFDEVIKQILAVED